MNFTQPLLSLVQTTVDPTLTLLAQWEPVVAQYERLRYADEAVSGAGTDYFLEGATAEEQAVGQRLFDLRYAAGEMVMIIPAPDLRALALKIVIALEEDRDLCPDQQGSLVADAKRLLAAVH